MRMPAHYYHNLYEDNPTEGTNVYVHYYNTDTTSTNTYANLRVKSGSTFKTLLFGGDGNCDWEGNILAIGGILQSTANGNTVQIGSQNNGFCHITSSANVPFWFNKDILMENGKTIGGANTAYRPFQIFLGRHTTSGSNALNAGNPLIEFSNADRSQYCQLIYDDYDSLCTPDSLTLVGNQNGINFICKNGPIWIQGGSNAGGNVNRLNTTSGMPGNMQYNAGHRGTQIYSNGIAFADPYNGNSNSDAGWIRHIETSSNNGILEIAVGDDGAEEIIARQYNTSNNVARQMYLLNGSGFTSVSNQSTDSSYMHAAMQIRETNFTGAGSDTWGQAPRLAWHWGGRVTAQIGLASNGWLYEAPNGTTFYKMVCETGTWGINITGSAGSVAWGNVTGKPATATRWPSWSEVTGKPSTFAPSSHTHTWLELAPGNKAASTGAAQSDDTGPFTVRWYSASGKIAQQPSTYGFLITCAAGKGSVEQHALWLEQCDGHIYHRGTNGGNNTAPPAFKKLWQSGDAVTNAVWNDLGESRKSITCEPGYAIAPSGTRTSTRLEPGARIISDTWGFLLGDENDTKKAPVAIAGRVLAYPLHDKSYYEVGDAVCAAEGGKIDKMTRDEIKEYPDRIIGIVNEIPDYDIWEPSREGGGREPVHTNGRIWIDVR